MSPDRVFNPTDPRIIRRATVLAAGFALAVSGCSKSSSHGSENACEKFGVYAQNRWSPIGAAERNKPDVLAQKIGGFAGNEVIAVDGWAHTGKSTYPTNTPPWNNDVWFHIANSPQGWVSFAGVRAQPTELDPTGRANGGQPALMTPNCEITLNK